MFETSVKGMFIIASPDIEKREMNVLINYKLLWVQNAAGNDLLNAVSIFLHNNFSVQRLEPFKTPEISATRCELSVTLNV